MSALRASEARDIDYEFFIARGVMILAPVMGTEKSRPFLCDRSEEEPREEENMGDANVYERDSERGKMREGVLDRSHLLR